MTEGLTLLSVNLNASEVDSVLFFWLLKGKKIASFSSPLFTFFLFLLSKITTPTWITATTDGAPEDQTLPATPVS